MYCVAIYWAKDMSTMDTKAQSQSLGAMESPNFLGLADGEVQQISQDAVRQELENKQADGFPVTHWNGGKPYRKYPDGQIEEIQI
jgi:hypothetical protein